MECAADATVRPEKGKRTRVFIVDDSPMMCKVMERIFSDDDEIHVVGTAMSGQSAMDGLARCEVDVCTLDVNMPGMNGITLLKHIMIRSPLPALMVSAFTSEGARITFDALRYGAVDFFQKPSQESGEDLEEQKTALRMKVKRAAGVSMGAARYLRLGRSAVRSPSFEAAGKTGYPAGVSVIGTSTGGYASLLGLFPAFTAPPREPVIVVAGMSGQHLDSFIEYLQAYTPFLLRRVRDRDVIQGGCAYFVSADEISSFEQNGDGLTLRVTRRTNLSDREGPLDLLLFSASEHFSEGTLAIYLSGDLREGVSGAREVHRLGGRIWVQRPDTCLSPVLVRDVMDAVEARSGLLPELVPVIQEWSRP